MHHGAVSPEIAAGLLALKKRIDAAKIPSSKLDETINIAIWNIREFGKVKRTDAALHYIAETINQFDLVAIVELRNNLEDLGCVMEYLATRGRSSSPIGPTIAAAMMSAPPFCMTAGLLLIMASPLSSMLRVSKRVTSGTAESFWRAPYLCSFRSGNFDFLAIAMHARWGDSEEARRDEPQRFSNWMKRRFESKYVEDHDLIVLGDCNNPS